MNNIVNGRIKSLSGKIFTLASAVFIALVMASCTDNGQRDEVTVTGDQAAMAFTAPSQLLQSRAVVQDNLILQLTVEGRVITVAPNSDGEYILRTTVTPDTQSIVSVEWFEMIGDRMVRLATASRTLNVGSASSPVSLRISAYNTMIDDDDDGISNLQERRDGTDFDDINDFNTALAIVTLDVIATLPSDLENAPDEIQSQITALASVNEEPIILTRDEDVWRGFADVTESSDPLVTVTIFATSDENLQIAEFSMSINVGQGAVVEIEPDAYDTASFDEDADTFSNAQEVARSSDPTDPTDPDADQDGVADEADNCPAVLNSQQADVDNDNVGDACDPFNNITDPDEDNVGDDDTPPDNCPQVANSNQVDTDGDGIGDACELPNVAPVADAGPDQTIQAGATLQLDGSGSTDSDGTLVSFTWFEGSSEVATGETAIITGLSVGQHLIDLVVTDNGDATGTDQLRVTVTAAPPSANVAPTAQAGPNQTIEDGTAAQLNGGASTDTDGTIASYQWLEDGVELATGVTPSITGLALGPHTIELIVTDDDGATDIDALVVNVTAAPPTNIAPTAQAGPNQTIEEGMIVQLDGSASTDGDGTIVSYQWLEDGVELATGVTPSITGLSLGPHAIQLIVTDDDGATDIDSLAVNVTAAPSANVAPTAQAGPNQTIQEDAALQLNGGGSTDSDGTIASYQWLENGVVLATGVAPSITGLAAGPHTIQLIVTDDDGATNTDSLVVTVTEAPPANVAPTAEAGPNQTVEEDTVVQLNGGASTDSDGTIASYQWLEDGVEFATGVMPSITGLAPGPHAIQLIVTDDDGATDIDSLAVNVTAAPPTNVAPIAQAGPNQTIEEGTALQLNGSASTDSDGAIASYQWIENGVELATGVAPSVTGLAPGQYVIQLIVTDDDGDTDADQLRVTVTETETETVTQ